MAKVVAYIRVSTERQDAANQLPAIEDWVRTRGYELVEVYQEAESAWRQGHQLELIRLMDDLRKRKVDIVLCWSLDRLTRQGIGAIFQLLYQFKVHGVKVMTVQEGWTEHMMADPMIDLYFAQVAWFANFESKRISERTRAGLARVRASGKHLGRPQGSKDKRKRGRTGYLLRWDKKTRSKNDDGKK
jgi:putative DNA-invertase from lambdoid prophage Rac